MPQPKFKTDLPYSIKTHVHTPAHVIFIDIHLHTCMHACLYVYLSISILECQVFRLIGSDVLLLPFAM